MSDRKDSPCPAGGRPVPGLLVALAAASALALLTVAMAEGRLTGPDHALLDALAALRNPVADGFFQAVTWLGSGYLLAPATLLLAAWLSTRGQGPAALRLVITYFGAVLTTWLLKQAIGRERPMLHPALADFIGMDWSFPSGHATHAAAFALGLWLALGDRRPEARRPAALALWGLAGLVGLVAVSRLHLQVHWPSDVLAGLLVAIGWTGLATAATRFGMTGGRTA